MKKIAWYFYIILCLIAIIIALGCIIYVLWDLVSNNMNIPFLIKILLCITVAIILSAMTLLFPPLKDFKYPEFME